MKRSRGRRRLGEDERVTASDADRPRPRFARFYASMTARMDAEGLAELRSELLAAAAGDVVEIGCGNGRNFTHYPEATRTVHAVEPEPHLRELATQNAQEAPVHVIVTSGRGEALPIDTASMDTAVLCLVLCAMPDPAATLAEIRRVLRPEGRLLFLEHTLAAGPGLQVLQRLADATIWPRIYGGCHTARLPLDSVQRAGFRLEQHRYLHYPSRLTVPASPHVIGCAVRA